MEWKEQPFTRSREWDAISGKQQHVYLVPESIYRKRPCTGFRECPMFITPDQVIDALNFKLGNFTAYGYAEYVIVGV